MLLATFFLAITSMIPSAISSNTHVPIHVSPGINVSFPGTSHLNCTDLHTGFSSNCFLSQNVSADLLNYNTSILLESCSATDLWSSCFQNSAFADPEARLPAGTSIRKIVSTTHNCTSLTTNASNSKLCSKPDVHAKNWTLSDWYGVWNIYSLQAHISVWNQALNASTSEVAISNMTTAHPSHNASLILSALIKSYGLDAAADASLRSLLAIPAPESTKNITSTVPGAGDSSSTTGETTQTDTFPFPYPFDIAPQFPPHTHDRVPTQLDRPTAKAWQKVLSARLEEVLRVAMCDFDAFYKTIKGGAYSNAAYSASGLLENSLRYGDGG